MSDLPIAAHASESAAQSLVETVAGSASFRKAPVLRDLLLYLWKHRGAAVSEYALGTEVLGRPVGFDPKTDSVVRVHVSRLRTRLKEYYETTPGSGLRVHIPPGEYRLEFVTARPALSSSAHEPRPSRGRAAVLALSALCLLLAADNLRLRWAPKPVERPRLEAFWQQFAQPGRPLGIVVPAPLFFRWDALVARDFRVTRPEDFAQSPFLERLRQDHGRPDVSQLYTIASDTVAASSLSRYLEDRGVPASVLDTPAVSLTMMDTQDAILLLGPGSANQVAGVMDRLGYAFTRSPSGVSRGLLDRSSGNGFPAQSLSPIRSIGYGVIALLPGKTKGTHILVVASSFNPALVSLLTNQTELAGLQAFLQEKNTGAYFEALIRYELNAERVLDARPVAARALKR
ncbi:MAG: helix-turn-helix domain-containing protein [Bryobacteraceae bacterium]|nr:helix-turn-helix domain-containing protein [Bryobacteraceae bacterium]